eukprot:5200540-Alexandrium_andersonii.AAC.1
MCIRDRSRACQDPILQYCSPPAAHRRPPAALRFPAAAHCHPPDAHGFPSAAHCRPPHAHRSPSAGHRCSAPIRAYPRMLRASAHLRARVSAAGRAA